MATTRRVGSRITPPTGVITYAYHPTTGNLATVSGPAGATLAFGYDGELVTDAVYGGPVAGTLHWTFDNRFRVVSETVNGGFAASFGYDADGLFTTAGALSLTPSAQTGLLTGTTLGSVTDSYGYNAHGDVTSYAAQFQSTPLLSVNTTRDVLGRIATKTETVEGTVHVYGYTYDLRGRLSDVTTDGVTSSHYELDANGNRLARITPTGTTSGTYDAQDRLLAYGTNVYTYGANGELASKTDSATAQTTLYEHNVVGSLTRVVLPGGPTIDYVTDGLGRRVGKKVNGTLAQGFVYRDLLRIAAETDGSGNVVSRFVYTARPNVPEYMVKAGATYRLVLDHLGSVRLVVNVTDGTIAQRMDYDEFGLVTLDTSPGFQPFGFAGGLYDPDTKLVRFGSRNYDATVGRWITKDPIGFRGGLGFYVYVGNDPVNLSDPAGLWPGNVALLTSKWVLR